MKKLLLTVLVMATVLSCQTNQQKAEAEARKKLESVKAKSPEPVKESIAPTGNAEYDKIRKDYKLFDKWKITNRLVKESWIYEIYQKGNEYIGVIPKWDYRIEVLEKKGFNYYIKGNSSGEYYRIDDEKYMTLYDKDGELYSAGYSAVKEK